MIRKRLLTALLLGSLLTVGAPAASAEDTTTYVTTGPVFNKPKGTAAEQGAILSHLGRLVNGARSGSEIRISLYMFGSGWLADQLAAAHRRNVNVQVLVDDDTVSNPWMAGAGALVRDKLNTAFAAVPPAGTTYGTSWFRVCAPDQPCLAKGTGGVNHNKIFLFSRTTGSGSPDKGKPVDDVVVQSSGNLTTWDRESAWNDAMTVAGNEALYAGYTRYFDLMTASQARPDGSGRVDNLAIDVEAAPAKGYFFPRNSTNPDAKTDVVENILSMIETPVTGPEGQPAAVCHGNTPGHGTADGRTVIRIANGHISRPAVAEKLWRLADAGCFVDIVYGKLADYEAQGVHRETAYWLTRTTAKGKIALHRLANDELKNPADPQASGTFSHTKYLLIEGSYKGVKDQKLIFTGSHTYTGMALTSNDEALLKYESAPVHDAYVLNFREQRAAADAEARYGGAE
ncbi:phospholipase D-like domain-containing protein [Streptomyces sp. H34-S4]|uniref:phospholipase D-like domain-containing protein n=1 Tax=Streptomyces sp. H34-S4 TaxID=2996463 RepID=UPI00226D7C1D|nr:phospholipase D-like domain-containing protein [Streptomyces sp. H34-S4]MCY0934115.1 phospholipase D-like domain-containing protein [Streptomyces sp. H34-S4]